MACAAWCHLERGDQNCERDPCKGCDRCAELAVIRGAQPSLAHTILVKPSDASLIYTGFVHKSVTALEATFNRAYTRVAGGWQPTVFENPGGRISWRTDAEHVVAFVNYRAPCNPQCPTSGQSRCYMGASCSCACRVKAFVDDVILDLPDAHSTAAMPGGVVSIEMLAKGSTPSKQLRSFTIELPWGAQIGFRGVSLQ